MTYQSDYYFKQLTLTAGSTAHYGNYIVRVSVALDLYPAFSAQEFTFAFEVVPNCLASTIIVQSINNMETPMNTEIKQTFGISTHAEQDVYNNYCGDLEYLNGGSSQFITLDTPTLELTVTCADASFVQNNYVCVASRLILYPANSVNSCFWVNVLHDCVPSSYAPNDILESPLNHHIGEDSSQSYAFGFPYSPCSPRFIPTYSLVVQKDGDVVAADWLSVDDSIPTSPNLMINTSNAADEGTYAVVISSQLNTVPIPRIADGTIPVEIFLKVDGCFKTVFSADHELNNMVFTLKYGQPDSTQVFAEYTDTVTDSGAYDCGPRKLTLTSTRDELIARADPATRTISVNTILAESQGTHLITMTVELENYPELTQYISFQKTFTVVVDGICDTAQFIDPGIADVLYQVLESSIFVNFEGIKDDQSLSNAPFDGYSYCGARTYVMSTRTTSAINYDDVQSVFEINSKEVSDVGKHEVTISASYNDYPGAASQAYSFFTNIIGPCTSYNLVAYDPDIPMLDISYVVGGPAKTEISSKWNYDIDIEMWETGFNKGVGSSICGKVIQSLQMENGSTVPYWISLQYSSDSQQGLVTVETDSATDTGEYAVQILYTSESFPAVNGGPTATQDFIVTVTSIDTATANLLPYLKPMPNDEYKLQIGKRFKWEFTYTDPENDAVEVEVTARGKGLDECRCMKLEKDSIGIWTLEITPNKKLYGQQIVVKAILKDVLSSSSQGFLLIIEKEPKKNILKKSEKRKKAKSQIEEIIQTDTEAGSIVSQIEEGTPDEIAQTQEYEEAKIELEKQQVIFEAKVDEFNDSIVGQKIASGEQLTATEIEEIVEEIPAPIPHVEENTENGTFDIGFSKPIAVPTQKNKVRMVKLLLENNMIEASLTSKETGLQIIGKPYFIEADFENNYREKTSRRLSESIPKVDKTINKFYETLKTLKETNRGRKLFADDLNDKEKGFSWTITSYERTGFKFAIKYNDASFVSEEGLDEMQVKFHDAEKYLMGEDGLKVPITEVKVKVPKQMGLENFALITIVCQATSIFVIFTIVIVCLILLLQSGAILRLMSMLLTSQLLINLGLTSYDYPANMLFLIRYMKSLFQGRKLPHDKFLWNGIGDYIGLQRFIPVTPTQPFSNYFQRTGFTTQSLIVNMGLLSSLFGLICLQLCAVLGMNLIAWKLNDRNKFAIISSNMTRSLLPQIMWFMLYAFMEILINVCVTFIEPEMAKSVIYEGDWSSGDFIQICVAGTFGLVTLAYFIFHGIFAFHKANLLAKIGTIVPEENPHAKGIEGLIRSYKIADHMKKKDDYEKQRAKKGFVKVIQHKAKKLKGMYDDELQSHDLPSAMKFISNNTAPMVAIPVVKQLDLEEVQGQVVYGEGQIFLEGGEYEKSQRRLKSKKSVPVEAEVDHGWDLSESDAEIDPFAVSAQSFMSAKSKRSSKSQVNDKKSAINAFWNWGKSFDKEEKRVQQAAKAKFMDTYGSIVELAKRKDYRNCVKDREIYLHNLQAAVNNDKYDLKEWMKNFRLELVLGADLKCYSQAALSFHFIFLARRILLVAAIFTLQEYAIFQFMVILYSSMAYLIYVGWVRPFKNEWNNRLEIFNEECVFICAFTCLLINSTRGIMSPRHRDNMGWFFIFMVLLNIVSNLVFISAQIIYDWKNSPVVLKRRARFARFYKMVREWDEEKCQCQCISCSGNSHPKIHIDRTPSKFEIKLQVCEVDTTYTTPLNTEKKYEFSLANSKSARFENDYSEEVKFNNPYEDMFSQSSSYQPAPFSNQGVSLREHTNSRPKTTEGWASDENGSSHGDSDEEIVERAAKQARYVDWYKPQLGEANFEEIMEDQRENMQTKSLKQVRFKEWEVSTLVGNDEGDGYYNLADEFDTGVQKIKGVQEFEERQAREQSIFLNKAAYGNELALIPHLNTINEDEEESEQEEKSVYQDDDWKLQMQKAESKQTRNAIGNKDKQAKNSLGIKALANYFEMANSQQDNVIINRHKASQKIIGMQEESSFEENDELDISGMLEENYDEEVSQSKSANKVSEFNGMNTTQQMLLDLGLSEKAPVQQIALTVSDEEE